MDWQTGEPPSDVMLNIRCDDYMGEYTSKAMRLNYTVRKPMYRKLWRWVDKDGYKLPRKEQPDAWAFIKESDND